MGHDTGWFCHRHYTEPINLFHDAKVYHKWNTNYRIERLIWRRLNAIDILIEYEEDYMEEPRVAGSTLRNLARRCTGIRKRASSWDRTGGNKDYLVINPGESVQLADIEGPGFITHIWITAGHGSRYFLREVVLRMLWDNEANPSVEVPLGDFFGMGHSITRNFSSLPLSMSPSEGSSMNCFFSMPFSDHALITVTNEGSKTLKLWFYINYELHKEIAKDFLRFHAKWHRENPTDGISDKNMSNEEFQQEGKNLTGEGNYTILEAEGVGHYIGCNLNIENLRNTEEMNWYGSGDDMIFIDGEGFPPSLHGTGTEDYFNTAWCPQREFSGLYHGITLGGGRNWSGKSSYYRFHIEDPIMFSKSIRVSMEHGHSNRRSDDWSSTAYWYQNEPHKPFEIMLPLKQRLPANDS